MTKYDFMMVATFVVGYAFITVEHYTKINKATVALLMATFCWMIQFANPEWVIHDNVRFLEHHLGDISQVILFLLGALTIVEIVNQHKGFRLISDCIQMRSKKRCFG